LNRNFPQPADDRRAGLQRPREAVDDQPHPLGKPQPNQRRLPASIATDLLPVTPAPVR
jgi:hypothetical protein